MDIEKKVYSDWAFTPNEDKKRDINREIYKELCEKYKISSAVREYDADEKIMKEIDFDKYDLVYKGKSGYGHTEYTIVKNSTNLTDDEIALICDGGNLCFGYVKEAKNTFHIYED